MKRVASSLVLLITILALLVSCVPVVPPSGCLEHIDLTDDGRCDFCGEEIDAPAREHISFTATERRKLVGLFGEVIPFMPCDEYALTDYSDAEYGDVGVNYYVKGATSAEFDAYLALFSGYQNDGSAEDEDGNTWYFFAKDSYYVDLSFYTVEGGTVMDLYAYMQGTPSGGDSGSSSYTYTEFKASERTALMDAYGFVIPFLACDDYYFASFADIGEDGDGHVYYAYDNTRAEFDAYLALFYTLYTSVSSKV